MSESLEYDDELLTENDDEDDDESAGDDEFLPFPPFLPFGGSTSRRRGVSTASNRSYSGNGMTAWVNRIEFNQSMSRVRADIAKSSAAIKTVDARVAAEAAANARQNTAIVKQNKALQAQSKALVNVKRQVKKAQDNALLMTLLMRPKTTDPITAAIPGVSLPPGARLTYESEKGMSPLLLMMLMGGLGGGDSGDSSNLALVLLASGGSL